MTILRFNSRRDKRISLATVYRGASRAKVSLNALRSAIGGCATNALRESTKDQLLDVETGKVIEFASPGIARLQTEIVARVGYTIVKSSVGVVWSTGEEKMREFQEPKRVAVIHLLKTIAPHIQLSDDC